ncbi:hypothetical protein CTAYLR_006320 [Chrysophaeum taylorii]|uniref:Uncharacterized protein n=1 Tax=Chrysophaeum taylorii TaxID=2483200 RepID=A0AAD7U9V7_9STRA|nr:hypothetical protein CTAYLR_006320 [Chrysophaeum taylorii]
MRRHASIALTLGGAALIASTGLAMRAAEVNGHVLFNPIEATFYAEAIKLGITFVWSMSKGGIPTDVMAPKLWLYFAPAATGYLVVNNMRYDLVRRVNPGLLAVLWNLKIVVIGALYSLPPSSRRLAPRQWLAAALIVVGTTTAQRSEFELAKGAQSGGWPAFALVFVVLVLSGASAVACELAYKHSALGLHLQNIVLYGEGVSFNYLALLLRELLAAAPRPRTMLVRTASFAGFSAWTWTVVLLQACAGYAVGAIFKYIDAIGQVVADVIAVVIATVFSVAFFGLQVDLGYAASLLLCLLAILLFYLPDDLFGPANSSNSSSNSSSKGDLVLTTTPSTPPRWQYAPVDKQLRHQHHDGDGDDDSSSAP